jgi:hypothetical protein
MIAGAVIAGLAFSAGRFGAWAALGVVVSIAVAGAIAGKLYGLLRAQTRLTKTIDEIASAVQDREPKRIEDWKCG